MPHYLFVIDTEEGKSSHDAGMLFDTPACAIARLDGPDGANATPSNRIARSKRKAEVEALTASLGHMRWDHAKVDWTSSRGTHSVPRDGADPAAKVRRRTGSASRGVGAHPGETGGAAMVRAAARGTEASEGDRFASALNTEEAIT